jgi:hypothetical protein
MKLMRDIEVMLVYVCQGVASSKLHARFVNVVGQIYAII